MFKFKDLSDKDEEFNVQDHLLTPRKFFEKRIDAYLIEQAIHYAPKENTFIPKELLEYCF